MERVSLVETPRRIYSKRSDYAERVLSEELGTRYIEYRRKWVDVSTRKLVTDFPLYIQIEHSGRCNLKCPSCVKGIEPLARAYSRGFKTLSMAGYKGILKEAVQYMCPSISFHNNDEPFLLPDLEERIRLAKDSGFLDIILTTNATLLNKDMTHKILRSGVTKINFSVGAVNETDYKERRKGGDFNTVLENIYYFLEQKKKANLRLPVIRATCVLTKDSFRDMDRFKEFWADKVDIVEFQNFQAIKGYTEGLKPNDAKIDTNFTCNAPWQQVVIRANGDVLPCCSFYGIELVIGNIKKSAIYDIWNGKLMKKIRKELMANNFNFSPACEKCSETFYTLEHD